MDSTSEPERPQPSGRCERPVVEWGDAVAWYRNADTSQHPQVAFVDLIQGDVVSLVAISPQGGVSRRLEGVRHVDDPEATRVPQMATKLGGWDTVDNHRDRVAAREDEGRRQREASAQRQSDDNERLQDEYLRMDDMIMDLHAKGMPALEIAKTISRQGGFRRASPTLSRINKVIREAGAAAPIG